jgi:hypothetical protein
MVAEEVFENWYNFNPITQSKKVILKVYYELSWARAAIRICGSVEPKPKEIFSAPQHWFAGCGILSAF